MALPKIASKFNSAIQRADQEQKITFLSSEVERLRAAQAPELEQELQLLREQLQNQSGEIQIDINLIDPNPNQPRQTINSNSVQAKARLLEKHGQITPVILVPQDNSRYRLLDGQLRWEAAKSLGWTTIRSVIVSPPEDLDQFSLLTFLGFEDLNPLDKAEAIFKELIKVTNLELSEISTILGTVLKRIEREQKTKELAKLTAVSLHEQQQGLEKLGIVATEQAVLLRLLELGLNPGSVKANLLPMLSLPRDLKEAIRQRSLKGAHALALSSLSAKTLNLSEQKAANERKAATDLVIEKELTVAETRALVKKLKVKYTKTQSTESQEVKAAISKIKKLSKPSFSKASPEQLQQLKTLLEQKLTEIDLALS